MATNHPTSLSAVIVAAGRSERFQKSAHEAGAVVADKSKLFLEWAGAPLIVHTLKALVAGLDLQQIALVIRPEEEPRFQSCLAEFFSPEVQKKFVFAWGGSRRQDSVRSGLLALAACDRVLIHDGARPFLDKDFLERLNQASQSARDDEGVIPALGVVETLKEVSAEGWVVKTHDRRRFVRVQTPQFFNTALLVRAHEELSNAAEEFTDDASMLEFLGKKIRVVEGGAANIKVTTWSDLAEMRAPRS